MSEAAAEVPRGGLGERLLDLLGDRVGEAGGRFTVSTKTLASELGVKPAAVSYQLHRLARAGHISTAAAGPRGTTIRLGGGARATGARGGAAAAARRAGQPATAFCPWCGRRAEDHSWRFCPSCGKELP